MAKYRLSYLGYGGYKSVDLEKLECLNGRKVTDIQVIDEFTTSFENLESLLEFLKRNRIVDEDINKLVITVDKKENGETINKKIYRGENLLFESDKNFLNMSFVYKWIIGHSDDSDLIIAICDNYIEKYKNAFNRISGSSYILSLFNSLRALAYNKKVNAEGYMRASEFKEFDDTVRDFINLEFYKIDKDILSKTGRIERKMENDGTYKKSYRNIHDFIILLKSMKINLNKSLQEDFVSKKKSTISIADNVQEQIEHYEEKEEFLTEDDILRTNKQFFDSIKSDIGSDMDDDYESRLDGHDFHYKMSREELEQSLYESGMSLVKIPKKEDLK